MDVFSSSERVWAESALQDHMDRVEKALPLPPTPRDAAEWARQREALRKEFMRRVGLPPPEAHEPSVRVVGVARRKDYRVERLVIESRPGCPVSATLYVPARAEFPAPAVLGPHGHAAQGKAYPLYQSCFVALAKMGFVVLSYDMQGYNEREFMGHKNVFTPLLRGGAFIGQIIWDGMKALDYLCSRPEVDASRIGVTGNSGGGKQSLCLSALDDRIAVSAPAGHNGTYAYTAGKERRLCACNMVPGLLRFGEMDRLYALIAPRPLLMVQSTGDNLFPMDSVRRVFRLTKRVYRLLGAEDKVDLFMGFCGHSYEQEKREAMYAWFLRHLMGVDDPEAAKEPRLRLEAPESPALRCFVEGRPEGALTSDDLGRLDGEAVLEKARRRLDRPNGEAAARRELRRVLWPAGRPRGKVTAESRGVSKSRAGAVEKVVLFTEPGVPVPCLIHTSRKKPRGVALIVDDAGKSSAKARKRVREALKAGRAAVAVDLRGWGETRPHELSDDGDLDEFVAAHRGLIYDAPLMGRRVHDLLAVHDWLRGRWPEAPVALFGVGQGAVAALLAAAVDGGFAEVNCDGLPRSFLPAKGKPADQPLAFYLYRVLQVGDIPDLAPLAAP